MRTQPKNLKGFRDFLPSEKRRRDYVTSKLIEVFETYGFNPIQTPTLESAALLMGKYGDEADKLLYKFEDQGGRLVALRYDQTVPTTRIISQYENDLPPYFRRYQIQNVFRSEKPQQGRYREFTQCDIDIFGVKSTFADAEIISCAYSALKNIGFKNFLIKINDRKILFSALEKFANEKVNVFSIIQSIDKLDKLSEEVIINELIEKGLDRKSAYKALLDIQKSPPTADLKSVMEDAITLGIDPQYLVYTPTLARGLDYYTGVMYEIVIPEYGNSSCAGGGRYDNLIGNLTKKDVPATGLAFGFDRLIEAAEKLDLINIKNDTADILVTVFNENCKPTSLEIGRMLRTSNIRTEIFAVEGKNLAKQMSYANKYGFKYVLISGESEIANNIVKIKFLTTGKEKDIPFQQVTQYFEGLVK